MSDAEALKAMNVAPVISVHCARGDGWLDKPTYWMQSFKALLNTVALRWEHLQLVVRDGCPDPPKIRRGALDHRAGGLGLRLVEQVASSWGWLPTETGKAVWVMLRLQPYGSAGLG